MISTREVDAEDRAPAPDWPGDQPDQMAGLRAVNLTEELRARREELRLLEEAQRRSGLLQQVADYEECLEHWKAVLHMREAELWGYVVTESAASPSPLQQALNRARELQGEADGEAVGLRAVNKNLRYWRSELWMAEHPPVQPPPGWTPKSQEAVLDQIEIEEAWSRREAQRLTVAARQEERRLRQRRDMQKNAIDEIARELEGLAAAAAHNPGLDTSRAQDLRDVIIPNLEQQLIAETRRLEVFACRGDDSSR